MLAFWVYPTMKPPPWTIRAPQKLFCWCYQTTAPRLTAITTNPAPDQRKSASVPLPNYYLLLLRHPFSSTSISTRARPRNIRHAYLPPTLRPTPSQPRTSNRSHETMKLLTLNFLTCAVKTCKTNPASFPLHPRETELEIVETDLNLAFLKNILPRVLWEEVRGICTEVSLFLLSLLREREGFFSGV